MGSVSPSSVSSRKDSSPELRRWAPARNRCFSILNRSSSNFGSWPVPNRLAGVDQERRQHFGVAVLARMHVEHEVDQRAFQLARPAPINGEPRAGDLGGAFQIQDAQLRAQIPMRLGFEIELARLPQRRTSTLSSALLPTGTDSCGNWEFPPASRETSRPRLDLFIQRGNALAHSAYFCCCRWCLRPACAVCRSPRSRCCAALSVVRLRSAPRGARHRARGTARRRAETRAWPGAGRWCQIGPEEVEIVHAD